MEIESVWSELHVKNNSFPLISVASGPSLRNYLLLNALKVGIQVTHTHTTYKFKPNSNCTLNYENCFNFVIRDFRLKSIIDKKNKNISNKVDKLTKFGLKIRP